MDFGPHEIEESDTAIHRILTLNFKHFLTAEMATSLFGFKSNMDQSLKEVYILLKHCVIRHRFCSKWVIMLCISVGLCDNIHSKIRVYVNIGDGEITQTGPWRACGQPGGSW